MEEDILQQIADMFKGQVQLELRKKRPSRTKKGLPKPVSGRYPTPISAPRATGRLYNSVNVYWEGSFEEQDLSMVLDFGDVDYWSFIDQGRNPNSGKRTGQMRPALAQWARVKPLPRFRDERGRFLSNEERAMLITRSVAKYGYEGTFFIQKAIDRTVNKIEDEIGNAAAIFFLNMFTGMEDGGTFQTRSNRTR